MVITLMTILLLAIPASAMDVLLTWDANTESDLAGYYCYAKQAPSRTFAKYSTIVAGPNQPRTCLVPGLDAAGKYTFVVTAFNSAGTESGLSNLVRLNIPSGSHRLRISRGAIIR